MTDILFRTQMVPTPLNATENLRLEDLDGTPIVAVSVTGQEGETAQVSGEGDPFSS